MSWRVPSVALIPGVRTLSRWERYRIRPIYAYFLDRRNRAVTGLALPATRSAYGSIHGMCITTCSGSAGPEAWKHPTLPIAAQQPIEEDPVLQASIAHWIHGLPWEQTGEVERMERAIRKKGQSRAAGPGRTSWPGAPGWTISSMCSSAKGASGRRASSSLERFGSSEVSVCTSANTGCRSERRTAGTGSP